MQDFLLLLFAALVAYTLGSIPFGLIIGKKFFNLDVREHGSGNIGATNCFRVLGRKWGALVFFLDVCKGVGAVYIGALILPRHFSENLPLLLGVFAIAGHTFPCWLKFKGGKGVATSLGVFSFLLPLPTLLTFLIWLISFIITRIISFASLVAALVFPIFVYLFNRDDEALFSYLAIAVVLSFFIFYTHRSNISRLLAGEEKKIF